MRLIYLLIALSVAVPSSGQVVPQAPFIYVTGASRVSAKADMAVLRFTLVEQNEDLASAIDRMKQRADKCFSILADFHVSDRDTTAHKQSVKQLTDRDKAQTVVGFRVTREFNVRIRDLTRFSDLTETLAKMGATEMDPAAFEYSRAAELEAKCENLALEDAKDHAARIAGEIDRKLGRVYAVSTIDMGGIEGAMLPGGYNEGVANFVQQIQPPPPTAQKEFIVPEITVEKSIHVVYLLD